MHAFLAFCAENFLKLGTHLKLTCRCKGVYVLQINTLFFFSVLHVDNSEVHSAPGGHSGLESQVLIVQLNNTHSYRLSSFFVLSCLFPTLHSLSKLSYLYAGPCLRLCFLGKPNKGTSSVGYSHLQFSRHE